VALSRAPRWLSIALLLILTLVGAWRGSRHQPAAGRETTLWLAVESLALDGDLAPSEADRERFENRFGAAPEQVRVEGTGTFKRYDAPAPWRGLAALARRTLGSPGPYVLQGLLASLALLLALSLLTPRLGGAAALLLATVCLFGSPLYYLFFRLEPHVVPAFAIALAAWLVWHRSGAPADGPEGVYRGDPGGPPARARWLGAGAAFALVAASSPTALPLAGPLLAGAERGRRGSAVGLFALGLAVVLVSLLLATGAPWPPIETALDLRLFAWAAVGLLAGRDVGALPYFLPVLLLAASLGARDGRRWSLAAVAAALALQATLAPFDFVEGTLPLGNGWFLAPFVLLLCAVGHGESRARTLSPLVLSALLLAPGWVAPASPSRLSAAVGALVEPVRRLLPVATTLRDLPGATDLERSGVLARGLAPGLVAGDRGDLRLVGGAAALVVESDRALSSVRIELGAPASAELAVRGGRLGNTILRPNGDIAYDIALDRDVARRHALWWSRSEGWIYLLDLSLGGEQRTPVSLDLTFGRPLVPAAEGR